MQKFRNLTKNIFFKIFLIFIAITFVGFGMTDIFSGGGNWIAKIGDQTITYEEYRKKLNQTSSLIYNSNPTEENIQLIRSNQFKIAVLQKISTQAMINQVRNNFNFTPKKEVLLKKIVKNNMFFDDFNNFNRQYFINFLKFNNLTEKEYLHQIQDDIFNEIINKSIALNIKDNTAISKIQYQDYSENRTIDIIRFSKDILKIKKKITKNDLEEFYQKNKNSFFFPEKRVISYIEFNEEDFAHKVIISEEELLEDYNNRLEFFTISEKRDFYHLLFNSKDEAKEFQKLLANNINEANFLNIAKKITKKDKNDILLKEISKNDLIDSLKKETFNLEIGQITKIIKSDIGYHILFLIKTTPKKIQEFNKVKAEIKKDLETAKKMTIFSQAQKEIDENLILNDSLEIIAKKFNLKLKKATGALGDKHNLDNLWKNSFAQQINKPSQIFHSESNQKFYAMEISKIIEKKLKNYQEAAVEVKKQLTENNKNENLQQFLIKAEKLLKKDPKNFYKLSIAENLKVTNKKINQRNEDLHKLFIENIFELEKTNETTNIKKYDTKYEIALLKKIENKFDENKFDEFNKNSKIALSQEILEEYNNYIRQKYQIRYNERILDSILNNDND